MAYRTRPSRQKCANMDTLYMRVKFLIRSALDAWESAIILKWKDLWRHLPGQTRFRGCDLFTSCNNARSRAKCQFSRSIDDNRFDKIATITFLLQHSTPFKTQHASILNEHFNTAHTKMQCKKSKNHLYICKMKRGEAIKAFEVFSKYVYWWPQLRQVTVSGLGV